MAAQANSKSNVERKHVRRMLENARLEGLGLTEEEIVKAKTRGHSKASMKRRKNYGHKRKHHPDYPEGEHNFKKQEKRKKTNKEGESRSESRISSPMSHVCSREDLEQHNQYKTGDENVS